MKVKLYFFFSPKLRRLMKRNYISTSSLILITIPLTLIFKFPIKYHKTTKKKREEIPSNLYKWYFRKQTENPYFTVTLILCFHNKKKITQFSENFIFVSCSLIELKKYEQKIQRTIRNYKRKTHNSPLPPLYTYNCISTNILFFFYEIFFLS